MNRKSKRIASFFFLSLLFFHQDLVANTLCRSVIKQLAAELRNNNLPTLLETVSDVNEETAKGQIQIIWMDGQPYLEFNTRTQTYFLNLDKEKLETGIHPIRRIQPERLRRLHVMERRFKAPLGGIFAGLDTTADGVLIPIFSSSSDLSIYRDLTNGDPFSLIDDYEPRRIYQVPLAIVKFRNVLGRSKEFTWLPQKIQKLVENGFTLSTIYSSKNLEQSPQAIANSSDYSALMIADDIGHGRVGILFYKNLPLIVQKSGQEYFIEIKGIGIATDVGDRIQNRGGLYDSHLIRAGRTDFYLGTRELEGYKILQEQYFLPQRLRKLLSRPVVAFSLMEFSQKTGNPSQAESQAISESELATQVFRVGTSSRRVAYVNPAFGLEYNLLKRGRSLRRAYGYMIGSLAASPRMGFTQSPHAENFIEFPAFQVALPIDYSDLIYDYESDRVPLSVGLSEMQVQYASYSNAFQDFIDGLYQALKDKKILTNRTRKFFKKKNLNQNLIDDFLRSEYYSYNILLKAKEKRNKYRPLEIQFQEHIFARDLDRLIAAENDEITRKNLLELHYNSQIFALKNLIDRLRQCLDSTFIQRDFPLFLQAGKNLMKQASAIVIRYENTIERQRRRSWPKDLSEYLKSDSADWIKLATDVDDAATILGLPTSNAEDLKKSKLGEYLTPSTNNE